MFCAAALAVAASAVAGGATSKPVAPGVSKPESTCFWEGPVSTLRPATRGFDGRNFNFPEESATYWLARFSLPGGAQLALRGRYPYGRYMSLNAYSDGAPTDALSDLAVEPRPGLDQPVRDGREARAGASARGRSRSSTGAAARRRRERQHALRAASPATRRSSSPTASTSPTAGST